MLLNKVIVKAQGMKSDRLGESSPNSVTDTCLSLGKLFVLKFSLVKWE